MLLQPLEQSAAAGMASAAGVPMGPTFTECGSGTALVAPISHAQGFPLHRLQSKTNET